jgi:pentatricopeptide repeat protein
MGFFESDRIRAKNLKISEALDIYDNMKNMGFSPADIVRQAEGLIHLDKNSNRNEIYLAVIEIARSVYESKRENSVFEPSNATD